MMARRGVIGVLTATVGALVLVGCGLMNSNYSYRYKITVEVDTPEGLKTGFAVHETIVGKSNVNLGELSARRGIRTRGEAVAVDLPGGQTLFVLVPNSAIPQKALDPVWKNDWVESAKRIVSGDVPDGPQAIRYSDPRQYNKSATYPLIVRFRDPQDPSTVELVQPDDLAASFGTGVRLKGITVQVTNDEVNLGIRRRIPWLSTDNLSVGVGPRLQAIPSGGTTHPTFGQTIAHGDFRSGLALR
jgi:hypothetical protein